MLAFWFWTLGFELFESLLKFLVEFCRWNRLAAWASWVFLCFCSMSRSWFFHRPTLTSCMRWWFTFRSFNSPFKSSLLPLCCHWIEIWITKVHRDRLNLRLLRLIILRVHRLLIRSSWNLTILIVIWFFEVFRCHYSYWCGIIRVEFAWTWIGVDCIMIGCLFLWCYQIFCIHMKCSQINNLSWSSCFT